MAKRLTKISTRTGDDGTTGLADGSRVPKDGPRIAAMGVIDELSCQFGILRSLALPESTAAELAAWQQRLFGIGAELALPGHPCITEEHIKALETVLERYNAQLPTLKEFILPGGGLPAAHAHMARAICRRAEVHMWQLHTVEPQNLNTLGWLNRLSDVLFVIARTLARAESADEPQWQRQS
ncbi:MAG: cob(I)yrinic acid a,c-diamide adenosyltransferase [Gammaproteobacteria bacterium]